MIENPASGRDDDEDVSSLEDEGVFDRLTGWFRADLAHWQDWRDEARRDYDFVAGEQWTDEEKAILRSQMRPTVVFNRIAPIVDTVSGSEIQNRQEVKYYPREIGDAKVNELYTSAAEWFRDQCMAEDEESDAFLDMLTCGLGWTETRLDFTENPDGEPIIERVDPLEIIVDAAARKANLLDARRVFRIKDMPRAEARELFPDADPALLDAPWARDEDAKTKSMDPPRYQRNEGGDDDVRDDDLVTIVHAQWIEFEDTYSVTDPETGQKIPLTAEQAGAFEARAVAAGMKSPVRKGTKRVWKQAFLGGELLEPVKPTLCDKCSWRALTGKRNRNDGTWYGLVRGMRDPQQWANKWMSQSMHILNTTAKGGILAETGAFLDPKQAEASYARPDAITWMANGAISAGRIMPKPGGGMPSGFFDLMQFAVSSVRDVSGINLEIMGQREGAQAGVLEYQRRQAAMTVMARYFDSLRRYRKSQGELLLSLIRDYLSDGRLVRIVGDAEAQYVPLIKQDGAGEFDIVVDEAPSGPNQKEQTWAIVQQMLPIVGNMLTPELWVDILQYSPLPSSFVEKVRKRIAEGGQQPQETPELLKARADIEAAQAKAQAEMQLRQMQIEADAAAARERAASDVEVMRLKAMAEMEIDRQKAAQTFQLRREEMLLEAQLKREQMAMLGPTAGPGDEANVSRN